MTTREMVFAYIKSVLYVKTNIDFVNFDNSDWATNELFDAYE